MCLHRQALESDSVDGLERPSPHGVMMGKTGSLK